MVVILTPSGTTPSPQYRCLNTINRIAIGTIEISDNSLYLEISDKKIAPKNNSIGANLVKVGPNGASKTKAMALGWDPIIEPTAIFNCKADLPSSFNSNMIPSWT